jgi:nucleoside phosphorylase
MKGALTLGRCGISLAVALGAVAGAHGVEAAPAGPQACTPRLLVLSAFPAELDALLVKATFSDNPTVVIEGRSFYLGRLAGNDVVMTLTGIGPVNAKATTQSALAHFRCGGASTITGVVFSGVAGGRTFIGDVTVPARWTLDNGASWYHVDATMLGTAAQVARSRAMKLEQDDPVGDPACACKDPGLVTVAHINHTPQIIVGGDGLTTDPVAGRALFCVPSGGDVFGCEPCRAPTHATPDAQRFATGVLPFVDPNFFRSELAAPPAPSTTYDASDEETAAVAGVAAHNGTPFIAFRAVSDGQGDPLHLPGFPAQFFVYRQLAADNAASVAAAFLDAWAKRPHAASEQAVAVSAAASSGQPGGVVLTGSPNTTAAAPVLPPLLTLAVLAVVCAAARLRRRRPTG